MIEASRLVEEARKLCGTPWRHQGRSRYGLDCIGLVWLAAKNAGGDVFSVAGVRDRRNYTREPSAEMAKTIEATCERIEIPVAGCLLLFKFPRDPWPRHVAIYTDAGTMIHAECRTRKQVIEHGWRMHWVDWTVGAFLMPGVKYV